MTRVFRFVSVLSLVFAAACSSSSTSPSTPSLNIPFSATDVTIGTGATAASGNTATVTYAGYLYSTTAADNKGTRFDSGVYSFRLGANQAIAGFDRGVTGMKVGGTRRVIIPPDLGYGSVAQSGIPANSTLLFDITLTAVQ
jgi:FKBP-type peptidyl-prolyl cis-trans isomerase FkpA